jgi:hypothetical protein
MNTSRSDIAEALSDADDVNGYEFRPTTPRPGDAWPLLSQLERGEGQTFAVVWRVMVFLPQDERQASAWFDAHYSDIVDALLPVGFVELIEPVALSAAGSEQMAMQITVRSD